MIKLGRLAVLPVALVAAGCAASDSRNVDASKASSSSTDAGTPATVTLPVSSSDEKSARLVFFSATNAYQAIGVSPWMPPIDQSGVDVSSTKGTTTSNNSVKVGKRVKGATRPSGSTGTADDASDKLAQADNDNKIWAACGGSKPASLVEQEGNETVFLTLAAEAVVWVANKIATWVVDKASDAVQTEVNKYTVTHSTTDTNVDFYNILSDGKGLSVGGKVAHVACYRYSLRGPGNPNNAKSPPTLMMDFIGSIKYDPTDPRVVTLKPVRLYVRRTTAKNAGHDMAIQIKLSANALAIKAAGVSYTPQAITATVAAAKFDATNLDQNPFYVTYSDSAPTTRIPLPDWDANSGASLATHNGMDTSLSVTEIGQLSTLLKALDAIVGSKNKDAVAKGITDPLDTWLKSQVSPPSKPGT
jgi:hypothetical protein